MQKGEFLMARALLIVGILMAMLVVPIWLKKGDDDKKTVARQAEARQNAPPPDARPVAATVPAAVNAPRPIGYGLTFAVVVDGKTPPDVAHLGCHGEPRPLDRPHKESCNPYKGDTSCRVVLPVLCLNPNGAKQPAGVDGSFYNGWARGMLAATQPVMGAILESETIASARCEKELGAGWRMAEFHDGSGGWGLQGQRGTGVGAGSNTRYWVHINDQPGNCWNSES